MARFEILDSNAAPLGEGPAVGDMLFELGMMYSVGRDMPVDLVSAHKWFNLAAMKGNVDAIRLRREVANQMSDVEIADRAARGARLAARQRRRRGAGDRGLKPPRAIKAYPVELGLAVIAGDGAAGLRTRNWYMAAKVRGASISKSCQRSRSVMAAGSGKRMAKRCRVGTSEQKALELHGVGREEGLDLAQRHALLAGRETTNRGIRWW